MGDALSMISYCKINSGKILIAAAFFSFLHFPVFSQPLTDSQVKLGYIYNFIKNISWAEENRIDTITVAVYGKEDELIRSLKSMERMEVNSKPILVKTIRSLGNIASAQVLFITNDQNNRIEDIFRQIQGSNTLLITDRCALQRYVMINFIYGADSLVRFEVNSKNIENAGLVMSPKLILLGGSEIDIRNLYLETEKTLVSEKERSDQYEKELNLKKQEIDQLNLTLLQLNTDAEIMKSEIASQKNELSTLTKQNLEQQRNIDLKNSTLNNQKVEIQKQEERLSLKEKDVQAVQKKIEEYSGVLNSQKDEIYNRQQTIEDQKYELNTQQTRIRLQRSYLVLLVSLIFMAITSLLLIYRNYKNRQRRNEELEKQHALVKQQRDQIAVQNKELEMHRTQLEQLVHERTIDLIAAKEKAEESGRLKSSFLANMSHEIRTPLNAIIGFTDLIFNEKVSTGTRKKYKQIVQSNSDLLLQLINDILDLAMIESEHLKVDLTDENLSKLIEHAFSSSETSKKNKLPADLSLRLILPNRTQRIRTDAIRFKQVLLNLIDNAIKYTEKGSIEIGFFVKENKATIFVKDTGIGIHPDQHQSIFDRFTKIENPILRFYRGIGLGLAIVKKLVEELGGEIWVESEPGKGSCFFFTQLLAPGSRLINGTSLASQQATAVAFTNKTILVCEDDDSNYFLLEKVLASSSITIQRAKNGQEAINYCSAGNLPDLILMDIKMPVMDGIEAARIIKNKLGYTRPIIAQTAYATSKEVQSYSPQFDAYITKPIERDRLIKALNHYLTDPA